MLFEGTWRGIEASDEVVDLLGRLTHVHAAHLVVRSHQAIEEIDGEGGC